MTQGSNHKSTTVDETRCHSTMTGRQVFPEHVAALFPGQPADNTGPVRQGCSGRQDGPHLRVLSLGAGVQSTALLILAAAPTRDGREPLVDHAIFADTGWEPASVYAHLDRLIGEVAGPAGITVHQVSSGNIRDDALNPARRFASMPLHVTNPDGTRGLARRQCTNEYKLRPILRKVRELLGAPLREDGVPGRVPKGRWAEQWIGISADESHRAMSTGTRVSYARARYPLLEPRITQGLTRADCQRILAAAGFPHTPKSACIGCPFHGNAQWRRMRDAAPTEFADAIAFDEAIRNGYAHATATGTPLRGHMYLHRSCQPLDTAPIDHVTRVEWAARQDTLPLPETNHTCSPWGCTTTPAMEGEPR